MNKVKIQSSMNKQTNDSVSVKKDNVTLRNEFGLWYNYLEDYFGSTMYMVIFFYIF